MVPRFLQLFCTATIRMRGALPSKRGGLKATLPRSRTSPGAFRPLRRTLRIFSVAHCRRHDSACRVDRISSSWPCSLPLSRMRFQMATRRCFHRIGHTAAWLGWALLLQFIASPAFATDTVNVYSIWPENWTKPLFEDFEKATGIKVNSVRFSSRWALARIVADKNSPPVDVLFGGARRGIRSRCQGGHLRVVQAAVL